MSRLRRLLIRTIAHKVYNLDIGFNKLDEMVDVVGAEIVEDIFNRQSGRKLDKDPKQEKDEGRHDELKSISGMP